MIQSEDEARERYDEMMNEAMPSWATPGRTAAQNMKDQDPTMYRCGFNDWIDGMMQDGEAPEEADGWCADDE